LDNKTLRQIGLATAVAVIMANMIGQGVFTSLGYQVLGIRSTFALLMLWVVGGAVALCGTLCYAELAVRFPGSGGEYNYLSKIYHPALGFMSGWVSATVGFAAPIAASSMAFGKYISLLFPALGQVGDKVLACLLILLIALINNAGVRTTSRFQQTVTYVNVGFIVLFILSGLLLADSSHFHINTQTEDLKAVFSPSFGLSLIYVSLAYSGWNAVTYIAGEVSQPRTSIPKASFGATLTVMLLYVLLNLTFMLATPLDSYLEKTPEGIRPRTEAAFVAAGAIFGSEWGRWTSLVIAFALMASVNSMTISGPRVTSRIGEDLPFFRHFTFRNAGGAPSLSILVQTSIALLLVITSTFETVTLYIGFTLSLFTTLTVLGLLLVRARKKPEQGDYHTPLFPFTPLLFIGLECYSIFYTLTERPLPSLMGLGTVILGLLVYELARRQQPQTRSNY
jgi:APA family basic amino acid/polyamine antiporter